MTFEPSTIYCLMGPTASGKTDLAIEMARQYPIEIVSVDSALVYKGMDIGTAKPAPELQNEIPHHLIDILEPSATYSAARFCRDAETAIRAIQARGHIPLLVGGTMLYFKALISGLSDLPSENATIRAALQAEACEIGWDSLHARLAQIDPNSANRIHPNDRQRLQRALEVYEISGKTMTELTLEASQRQASRFVQWAIVPQDRALLHQRIEKRFEQMLDEGFLDEVRALMARGDLHPDCPSMRSVGYRQARAYLTGQIDYDTMVQKGIAATRQLAKRQLTWLRTWPDVLTLNPDAVSTKALLSQLM